MQPPPVHVVTVHCPCGEALAGAPGTAITCRRCGQVLAIAAPMQRPAPAGRSSGNAFALLVGAAGIVVAIGYTFVGGMFLMDVQRVVSMVGAQGEQASEGITVMLMIGLAITAMTVYVGVRAARGGVVSMFILSVLNMMFAGATSSMLDGTRQGSRNNVLAELVHRRLSALEPLGTAATIVAVAALASAVYTIIRRSTSKAR